MMNIISFYCNHIIVLLSYIICFYLTACYFKKINIVRNIILSIVLYFSLYVILSACFFWIDRFSLFKVLVTELSLLICFFLYTYITKHKVQIEYDIKGYLIPLVISLMILPITIDNFELFGFGQDEGVYQMKAIDLIYGNSERQQDFQELQFYSGEGAERYSYLLKTRLAGFDRYDYLKPTLSKEDKMSSVSGIYHGIPTYPALLALWGSMFGIENMMDIQTIFLLCCIFIVHLIAKNLQLDESINALITFIFAISPMVLWVSKSSLTEMFLCVVIVSFIYFITHDKEKYHIMSTYFVLVYSFFHVTIYTLMPIFVVVYLVLGIITKKKKYIHYITVITSSFCVGFTMMAYVSPTYMFNNYYRSPINKIISQDNSLIFVYIISLLTILFSHIVYNSYVKYDMKKYFNKKNIEAIIKVTVFLLGIYIIIYGFMIAYGYKDVGRESTQGYYYGNGLKAFQQLTITAFLYGAGFFLLPYIIHCIFMKSGRLIENNKKITVFLLFFYCVIIYSVVLRKEVPHYYYYSRYLVPLIPLVTIMFGLLANKLNIKKSLVLAIIIFSIYVPYNFALANYNDDTRMEWDVLNRICENLEPKSTVMLDKKLMQTLYTSLRSIRDAEVYLILSQLDEDITKLSQKEKNLYIISTTEINNNFAEKILVIDNNSSYDKVHDRNQVIPFPKYIDQGKTYIFVYKVHNEQYIYDMTDSQISSSGFYNLEKSFRWTRDGATSISTYIIPRDYMICIKQGPGIPFDKLNIDLLDIDLYINNMYFQTLTVDGRNNGQDLNIAVDEKYLKSGHNEILFKYNTWSPSDYGSEDYRNMGISIKEIRFDPKVYILKYNFGSDKEPINFVGFSGKENDFRWTSLPNASVSILVDNNKDYKGRINIKSTVALKELERDSFSGYVKINDGIEQQFSFAKDDKQEYIEFQINKAELKDEVFNTLNIFTDTWSPSEYGSRDTRTLGIAIDDIVLQEIE